jgi:YYY domain-containing protein
MLKDLLSVINWWFVLLVLGTIFLPLTTRIFNKFFDKGYLFSKVFAIGITAYLVWLLASLKILPFFQETIWLVILLILVINFWLLSKKKIMILPSLKIAVAEEVMFLLTLVFWSYIRGFQPDIQGLEKFMDFGFVNSILRSPYFPPADMWFAGKSINYYYFGHYITAFLTKLSGIPSSITYNLMMATLFAFCFSLTFSITANLIYLWQKVKSLKPIIIAGLLSACLISLGANLHPAYYNFKMKILQKPYCNGSYNYWYPDATRYIGYCPDVEDKTIHEFPSYSFIVSDLHGHVSDIPFVLTFLALSLRLLFDFIDHQKKQNLFHQLLPHLLISFLLGIMFMTNQWDFPIYLMILGFALWFSFYQKNKNLSQSFIRAALYGIIFLIFSVPVFLPFQLGFEPITKGIAFVRAHSLIYQLLVLWGAPWFFGLTFLFFLFRDKIRFSLKKESFIKWLSTTLGVKVEIKSSNVNDQPSAVSSPRFAVEAGLQPSDIFIIILLLVATILVIIPEIIYVKDIYIASYHRANTMFKLTYQSFMMFSILIGYIFVRIITSLNKGFIRKITFTFFIFIFSFLLLFPFYAIPGYYGQILTKENYKGLYGLNFLAKLYPDDYAAILWLNKNIIGQPIVLEAVGDSYTDYERISMATGLPTIEGWLVHEWLWRGSYDEPGKRNGEVQQIYETNDLNLAKDLLNKYHVRYVVVGEMERKKYTNLSETKFDSLGKIVFQQTTTKIYQLN